MAEIAVAVAAVIGLAVLGRALYGVLTRLPFWAGVNERRGRGPPARGRKALIAPSSTTRVVVAMLMIIGSDLALSGRSCYEPLASTHPDRQGRRRSSSGA